MRYVIVNNEDKTVKLMTDSTQVAQYLGISARTVQRNAVKGHMDRGIYTVYYSEEGMIPSKRGKK